MCIATQRRCIEGRQFECRNAAKVYRGSSVRVPERSEGVSRTALYLQKTLINASNFSRSRYNFIPLHFIKSLELTRGLSVRVPKRSEGVSRTALYLQKTLINASNFSRSRYNFIPLHFIKSLELTRTIQFYSVALLRKHLIIIKLYFLM